MSEEMNRQEAELNERELSGVSGGESTEEEAHRLCQSCPRRPGTSKPCAGGEKELCWYIVRNGHFLTYASCPFFKKT